MHDLKWSTGEKKIAQAAFDAAQDRERRSIRLEIEGMLQRAENHRVIWDIHDYLNEKRRELDQKYDYRYSQLIMVFGILLRQGWLSENDLAGLSAEKLEAIRRISSVR
jgi:hypothetical protein